MKKENEKSTRRNKANKIAQNKIDEASNDNRNTNEKGK